MQAVLNVKESIKNYIVNVERSVNRLVYHAHPMDNNWPKDGPVGNNNQANTKVHQGKAHDY